MSKAVNKLVKISTFGKVDLDPKIPKPGDAETAPDVDDKTAARAKQRELQRRRGSGRTSTVLTGETNTLG